MPTQDANKTPETDKQQEKREADEKARLEQEAGDITLALYKTLKERRQFSDAQLEKFKKAEEKKGAVTIRLISPDSELQIQIVSDSSLFVYKPGTKVAEDLDEFCNTVSDFQKVCESKNIDDLEYILFGNNLDKLFEAARALKAQNIELHEMVVTTPDGKAKDRYNKDQIESMLSKVSLISQKKAPSR